MSEDLCLLPKSVLTIRLPRKSPFMLKMIVLAAAMMCGVVISFRCLKHTKIEVMPESMKLQTLEKYLNDFNIDDLKQTEVEKKLEFTRTRLIKEHSKDPSIVGLKQIKILNNPQVETSTKLKVRHSYNTGISSLNQMQKQIKSESQKTTLQQQHCHNHGILQSEIAYVHYPVPTNYSRYDCACTPVRFYVLVSMQRSGTKWFESFLDNHVNISSVGDIFIGRERNMNLSVITELMDKVYNLDWNRSVTKKGCIAAVGFKWMLNKGILENYEEISKYFMRRGVSIIFLFRRNQLRRMISAAANNEDHTQLDGRHKAHVSTQSEADTLAKYRPKLDARSLVSKLKHSAARADEAIEKFKSIRHVVLYYEDLVQNTTQKLAEVMEFLHVPQQRLRSGHLKIHTKPLSQMVSNWNDVKKALMGSPYESFLTSDY